MELLNPVKGFFLCQVPDELVLLDLDLFRRESPVQLDEVHGSGPNCGPIVDLEPLDGSVLVLDHPALVIGEGPLLRRVHRGMKPFDGLRDGRPEVLSRFLRGRANLVVDTFEIGPLLFRDDLLDDLRIGIKGHRCSLRPGLVLATRSWLALLERLPDLRLKVFVNVRDHPLGTYWVSDSTSNGSPSLHSSLSISYVQAYVFPLAS